MHWCSGCDVFPKTAKDFLSHLHTKEHIDKHNDSPWHSKVENDEMPQYSNAPTKRTPIRGLQFFVPSTAWYCKLCTMWMGDLHCASLHLKSTLHAEKCNEYVEQNPHFEIDWMAERQKAYETFRDRIPQTSLPSQIIAASNSSKSNSMEMFEGIPLQLKGQKAGESDSGNDKKGGKKKKNKKR